ncbi:protein kish-B-like [Antedon mediterranea]|uniref:protein kish-B-like n=1 Tax=Antedon mediterranea TaxID=105859 RepID=UPI003AF984F1
MTNVYSFDGLIILALLIICTCAYMRRVPRLKKWFLSEKKGFLGIFYKASIIGTRLHFAVAITCTFMAVYVLLLK